MHTTSDKLQAGLEADIQHLRDEIATIELTTALATGAELQQMQAEQKELRETMESKQRQLSLLQKGPSRQSLYLMGLVLLLLLACCTRTLTTSSSHLEQESPTSVAQEGAHRE